MKGLTLKDYNSIKLEMQIKTNMKMMAKKIMVDNMIFYLSYSITPLQEIVIIFCYIIG